MDQRLLFIDKSDDQLSIRKQCELLGVHRSALYYQHKDDEVDIWLINLIRDIWLQYPFYGYRKIKIVLKIENNLEVNNKRVLRLMQIAGIQAIYPKPHLSKANPAHRKFPYLLRDIKITRANQVWMVDITYLKLGTRFVYLVALIDVYSRYIVGWSLSFELDTENCLDALQMALSHGKPEIINSDQGCQLTSNSWIEKLTQLDIKISMDGNGRCQDNIYIERFWRTIKYEAIYLNEYNNYQELYLGIKNYITFYNKRRPHQSLKYQTPEMVYTKTFDQELDQINNGKIFFPLKNLIKVPAIWLTKQLVGLKITTGVDSL
jgi:putative transposase